MAGKDRLISPSGLQGRSALVRLDMKAMALPRRLMLANGLAITAVVINHAAQWGIISLFWWADSYRPVESLPDLTAFNSAPYYILLAAYVFTHFSVPLFLLASGYFTAYAFAQENQSRLQLRIVKSRLTNLLIPYFIWSTVIFAVRWLESCEESCQAERLTTYASQLLFGKAIGAYYYIFVLTVLFLLSPLLVRVAKRYWCVLLAGTWLVQLCVLLTNYALVSLPAVAESILHTEIATIFILMFYFILGIISKMHWEEIRQLAQRVRRYLAAMVVVLGVLAYIDITWVSRIEGLAPTLQHRSLFAYCFATAVAFSLIATGRMPSRGKSLFRLSGSVYGIYLLHPLLLEYLARVVHRFLPWFLGYPLALQLFLVAGSIGLPLLFMTAVRRSPLRPYYRYLFG